MAEQSCESASSSHILPIVYKMYYSIETALLRMHSDILQVVDKDNVFFLVLFDQSVLFDMVEYDILMKRLEESILVMERALHSCISYFADRRQAFDVLGVTFVPHLLKGGMPQGSVIEPFVFAMYTAPIEKYGTNMVSVTKFSLIIANYTGPSNRRMRMN